MTEKTKNYLGFAGIVALVAFAVASLSYVHSYSKSFEPGSYRSFGVSGEGKVIAVPDVATFSFSVISQGKNVQDLQAANTDKVNKAIAYIKSKGVESRDISTSNYSVNPQYQSCQPVAPNYSCPPPQIVGYTIEQTVAIKVRDFTKTGDLLNGVVSNGANSVSQLSFTVDDRTKVENEAREKAIKDAKEKAKAVAKAGGFGLGRLLSIDEGYYPVPYYGKGGSGAERLQAMDAVAASPPTIEPGSQEVIITVNLRYEID